MAEIVGGAELTVGPSVKGFGSKLSRILQPELAKSGRRAGEQLGDGISRGAQSRLRSGGGGFSRAGERAGRDYGAGINRGFKKGFKASAIGTAATLGISSGLLGLGGLVKDSVQTEAAFSQRMAQIKVNVNDATTASIESLGKLAIKLGQDTVFSANDAADAMLELAKGGFKQAQIAGGGVQATMNLAAAEGMGLADAATIVANNMNAYSIKASQASKITDALAAGSAASTASVTSLADGLSNVGGVARNFGFNINDTVGVLAAFDQNAIRGAEGGTALRSLLTHLAAPTQKAHDEMDELGISLADAHGNFRDITDIAEQFRTKLSGVSQAEQARISKVIAGAYGQRALNVLVKEGAAGLTKYIDATKQQGKAQELAKARMSGTAGALERLSGAVETGELAIGKALAPAVNNLANYLANKAVPATTEYIEAFQNGTGPAGELRDTLEQVGHVLEDVFNAGRTVVGVFNGLPGGMKKVAVEGLIAYKALRLLQGGFDAASISATNLGRSAFRQVSVEAQSFDRYTANSVAQQGRLQGSLTKTQLNLGGLKGAAQSAAGVAGLLGLTAASQQSSKAMGGLEGALSGAALGFALTGNPIGALIGAAGGGLLGVFTSGLKAADGIDAAALAAQRSRDDLSTLSDELSDVTDGYDKLARKQITDALRNQLGGNFNDLSKLGLKIDTVASAQLGDPKALQAVSVAIDKAADNYKNAGFDFTTGTSYATRGQGDAYRAAAALQAAMKITAGTVRKEKQEALEASLANGVLAKSFKKIPDQKVINIGTESAQKAKADIIALEAQGDGLSRKQIKLLLGIANLPKTKADILAIEKAADRAARARRVDFDVHITSSTNSVLADGNLPPYPGGRDGNPKTPYPRVMGGPVRAGVPYLVGERRPELFVPNTAGRIEPRVRVAPAAKQEQTVVSLAGSRMTLRVGDRAFQAYVEEIADERVGSDRALAGERERAFG